MHILQVVSGRDLNGAMVYSRLLANTLASRGHRVTLLCRPGSWLLEQEYESDVDLFASEMKRLPTRDLRQAAQWSKSNQVDLIHTHMTRGHSFGVLLRMMTGIPVVATAHCRSFQLHWKFNDFVIANSASTEAFQRKVNRVSPAKMKTIYCCSDLERFQNPSLKQIRIARRAMGIQDNEPVIGIVGDVCARKGHDCLFEALPRIMSEVPNLKLAVLGRFRRRIPFTMKLRRMLLEQNLQNRVEWLGIHSNVEAFMSLFDVSVVPSIEEPLGLVAIESLATGTPVVASNTGGLPEIVKHEKTGMLFPVGDADALATSVLRCLRDKELCRQLGNTGQQYVLDRFSPNALMPQIEAIYDQVLSPRAAA